MANYFVGDIQGCFEELQRLLQKVSFNPSKDILWAVGDLVARGPDSLETLRLFESLQDSGKVVLGNHDLHLMAIHGKIKRANPNDRLQALLEAPDCPKLINWLRQQPLARYIPEHNLIMSHAGVPPQWNLATLISESLMVSEQLKQADYLTSIIGQMYQNKPNFWNNNLNGIERTIYCINALTRMRFLHSDASLDFECKLPPNQVKDKMLRPWFDFESKLKAPYQIVFGHWAALMGQTSASHLHALDTGCCWGEHLTLWHLETNEKITQKKLI
ncbi:symmetrical bis(5'-nucleosyl)-tetraphosphatase [Shewanella glacialimarina]|jgi:bis(5'-nucleosyl)-tetraphosphatase (symmetrical)|uniref:symmetrical bis(5'-nucleosyl)-tetraphosphatase n=1 Tax=Shewanella glacialimarina TaxID=2590884 RepID=UPI001CF7FDF4|nr:symmetrical bis(5'-nucleosyl)-tetraphosphatase [Shewanella glacialimarina]UCX03834.1 symmetrical bis(5'-nucleosyl)-tetraphosphatase [Shewanella glacialimarina]